MTKRATCVLGVASSHDDRALLALRGDVEVTIEAAGMRDGFHATLTPFFLGDDGLVFRRGPELRGRTIAYDASKSAAEIDRDLVRALADPDVELTVTVRELGTGDRAGVLFVVAVPIGNDDDLSPRARRVLEAADRRARRGHAALPRPGAPGGSRRRRDAVLSYHEHNEDARVGDVLARLADGARDRARERCGHAVGSDPGYVVVRRRGCGRARR